MPARQEPCVPEIDKIAMRHILRIFDTRYNYLSIWLSHDYAIESWKPRLDAEQREIDRITQWSQSLTDPCIRAAYANWLDYVQRDLDSAWQELRTKDTKIRQDAFSEEMRKDNEEITRYPKKVPAPPRKQ